MGGWRMRRSIRIAPGFKVNLTGRSAGISVGPRGFKLGFNTRQGLYAHQSIPNTGIYRRTHLGKPSIVSGTTAIPRHLNTHFFDWIRRLFIGTSAASRTVSPEHSKTPITSAFLVTQQSAFAALADPAGNVHVSGIAPDWVRSLYDEAQYVARTGETTQGGNPEWHGFTPESPEMSAARCIALTPVKQLITKWANAIRHYKPLNMQDVEVALRPHLAMMCGFQSLTKRSLDGYTGVIFVSGKTVHSTETFPLKQESLANGVFNYAIAINFNLADIGEQLSAPFTYAIIREHDEVRYTFAGGMR